MQRFGRLGWALWFGAGLMLMIGGAAPAPAPDATSPAAVAEGDPEPITPIPLPPVADPAKLALGERLFNDVRLSHDNTRSCASCHDVRTNGADAALHDTAIDGSPLPLNTNTVFNAALSFRLNWEGNIRTLEDQAANSIESPGIMAIGIDRVLDKLRADPDVVDKFKQAYGHGPDRASLLDAIATYERSLVTPASRFDLWLNGDATALSADEQRGYQLFTSLGCISCHQGVNVGGNLFERHGIFHPLASPTPEILRVPSLRNVATTAPYFHDGSALTLGDAVRRMGVAQLDRTLTDDQVVAIVAFLHTLTGTYRGHSVTAASP
jgi:cytochrome c peroxidase